MHNDCATEGSGEHKTKTPLVHYWLVVKALITAMLYMYMLVGPVQWDCIYFPRNITGGSFKYTS